MVALSRHLWNNECLNFQEENNMVTLHTNFGDIKIKLDFDKAPITAENFLNYCKPLYLYQKNYYVYQYQSNRLNLQKTPSVTVVHPRPGYT